jgi:hypothetical protein
MPDIFRSRALRRLATHLPAPSIASSLPRALTPVLGMILLLAAATAAAAQSAEEILERAMELHEDRLAGTEDLTIHQTVMGISTTAYLVRETVEGIPVLRPRSVDAAGIDVDVAEEAWDVWADPRAMYGEWADRWTVEGEGAVEGHATWRLLLTDFEGIDFDEGLVPGQAGAFEPTRIALELDRELLVPREMTLEGSVEEGGTIRPITAQMRFSDYRTVSGYVHPFLTVIEMDLASAGLSAEQVEEAQVALAELQRAMEDMPAAQREMMQQMMGEQMQMMERVAAGGAMELEIRVTELQVNAGPPGG